MNTVTRKISTPIEGIRCRISSINNHTLPWHTHPDFCICLVENGQMAISKDGVAYVLRVGDVGFFNPNELHNTESSGTQGCRYKTLNINFKMLPSLTSRFSIENDEEIGFTVSVARDKEFFNKISDVLNIFEEIKNLKDVDENVNRIMELLIRGEVLEYKKENIYAMDYYSYVKKYLDLHYLDCLSVKELADRLSISQSHLIRTFNATIGLTPYQYILTRRIHKAKELLRLGYSSSDTAFFCKFSDQCSFSKAFKKFVGESPRKYQKSIQKKPLAESQKSLP